MALIPEPRQQDDEIVFYLTIWVTPPPVQNRQVASATPDQSNGMIFTSAAVDWYSYFCLFVPETLTLRNIHGVSRGKLYCFYKHRSNVGVASASAAP
jgi:hypothetical protein